MQIVFHKAARAELQDAVKYYESRVPALGQTFLENVHKALIGVQAAPTRWPQARESDIRRCPIRRFPFVVYYRLASAEKLEILAVKHHRRDPAYWKDRIEEQG